MISPFNVLLERLSDGGGFVCAGPVLNIIGCFPLVSGTLSLLFLRKPPLPKGVVPPGGPASGDGSIYSGGGGTKMVELRTRGGEVVRSP